MTQLQETPRFGAYSGPLLFESMARHSPHLHLKEAYRLVRAQIGALGEPYLLMESCEDHGISLYTRAREIIMAKMAKSAYVLEGTKNDELWQQLNDWDNNNLARLDKELASRPSRLAKKLSRVQILAIINSAALLGRALTINPQYIVDTRLDFSDLVNEYVAFLTDESGKPIGNTMETLLKYDEVK